MQAVSLNPFRHRHRPWLNPVTWGLLAVAWLGLVSGIFCQSVSAQDANGVSVEQLQSSYDASIEKLREQLKALRRTRAQYMFSDSEESHDHKDKWDSLATESEAQFKKIREIAYALFLAKEKPDENLTTVVRKS